jgi:hypothetical protein
MSLSLVGAALTAGAAQAERPDDRGGMLGVGAASASTQTAAGTIPYLSHGIGVGAASASAVAPSTVPDAFERAVARPIGTGTRPDDRGEARGPRVYFSVPRPVTRAVSADDFQWRDASAGAGAAILAILLAAGVTVSIRHRGRTALS